MMADHAATRTESAVQTVQRYAKGITATVGALLTSGAVVLPDNVAPWVALGMAAVTAVATTAIPNRKPEVPTTTAPTTTAGYPDDQKYEPGDAIV